VADDKYGPISYNTVMRLATAPTHLGAAVLKATLVSNSISEPTVAASRKRVAIALRLLYRSRLAAVADQIAAGSAALPLGSPDGVRALLDGSPDTDEEVVSAVCTSRVLV
jgi:hypothetical protein